MRKKIMLLIALIGLSFGVNAQKIGHLNSGNMLTFMPEAAKADTVLVIFRNGLMAKGDTLAMAFKKEYDAFMGAYNAGTLSAQQAQKRQADLENQQKALQAYGQDMEQQVATLRQQLLQPILAKLDEAIKAVAKENMFTIIFDTASGSSLYAQESDDIMPLVKQKLGIK
jgi:outer membrane protein